MGEERLILNEQLLRLKHCLIMGDGITEEEKT